MLFFSFVLFQCLNLSMSSSFRNALATVKIVNPLGRSQQCFIQLEKCFLPFKFLLPTAAIPEWDGACKNILFEVVDAPTVVGVVLCGTAGVGRSPKLVHIHHLIRQRSIGGTVLALTLLGTQRYGLCPEPCHC